MPVTDGGPTRCAAPGGRHSPFPQQGRNILRISILLIGALAAATLAACGGGNDEPLPVTSFNVAVMGDVPYGTTPTDTAQSVALPAFLKAVNDDTSISQVVHVGDIHSGKQFCTQAYDQATYDMYKTLVAPLVYTPGDNEWADCHKAGEGGGTFNTTSGAIDYVLDGSGNRADYAGGNPVDNLALVRTIFFPAPGKTIGGAMTVHTQAQEYDTAFPTDAQYVENVWFIKTGVLFVTVNIPGGSNNGTDPWYGAPAQSASQVQEVANRSGATLRWLKAAFDRAATENAKAIVIVEQADMWDFDGKPASHIAGYKQYVDLIATRTTQFAKPVLLFNGDSHIYRSDNPLAHGAPCVYEPTSGAAAVACTFDSYDGQPNGYNVSNFHRVTVHGSTTPLEWLKLTVDTNANAANGSTAFGPFSWQRQPH